MNRSLPPRPAAVLVGLAAAFGCSSKPDPATGPPPRDLKWTARKVTGAVTYNGKPVPYGYVLFYTPGTERMTEGGIRIAPTAVGVIGPDGRYQIAGAPVGPVRVCVATDPDADPNSLMGPTSPSAHGGPSGPPAPPDPGRPPDLPPEPGALPPLPIGKDGKPFNPETEKLSAEEKKRLRGLHEKFGVLDRSPLAFVVADGPTDQTFDIVLPPQAAKP